jgi:hypothetical protein
MTFCTPFIARGMIPKYPRNDRQHDRYLSPSKARSMDKPSMLRSLPFENPSLKRVSVIIKAVHILFY